MRLAAVASLLLLVTAPATAQSRDSLSPIDTDRPDLTDGTGTVAPGRIQFESGFTSQGSPDGLSSWSAPELLVRVGVFSRAEFRISQTYRSIESGPGQRVSGFDDLQVGSKFRLVDRPAYAISAEAFTTLATGSAGISAGRILPGAAILLQMAPIGRLSAGAEFEMARGAVTSNYSDFSSLSVQYQATKRLQAYGEWYQIQPEGPSGVGEPYLNSGFLLLLANDVQVDARVGFGLTHHSDRYFVGFGFAVRR